MGHIVTFSVPKEDVQWIEDFLLFQKNRGIDKSKAIMTALRRYAPTVDEWAQHQKDHNDQQIHFKQYGFVVHSEEEGKEEQQPLLEVEQRIEEDSHRKHIRPDIGLMQPPEQLAHFEKFAKSCPECFKQVTRLKE